MIPTASMMGDPRQTRSLLQGELINLRSSSPRVLGFSLAPSWEVTPPRNWAAPWVPPRSPGLDNAAIEIEFAIGEAEIGIRILSALTPFEDPAAGTYLDDLSALFRPPREVRFTPEGIAGVARGLLAARTRLGAGLSSAVLWLAMARAINPSAEGGTRIPARFVRQSPPPTEPDIAWDPEEAKVERVMRDLLG
jgi:hypothetical protein